MSYQVQRKSRIKETLELLDETGAVVESLDVDLNVDQIAGRVNKAYEVLGAAQTALQKNARSDESLEAYGKAVLAVFDVIFGEDGTKKLISFYDGNFNEMLLDVFPFINDEVMPKIRAASADRREQMLAAVKASKKARRRW